MPNKTFRLIHRYSQYVYFVRSFDEELNWKDVEMVHHRELKFLIVSDCNVVQFDERNSVSSEMFSRSQMIEDYVIDQYQLHLITECITSI